MKPILLLLSSCFLAISAIGQESCANAAEATLGTNIVIANSGNDAPLPESCLNLMGDELFLWYYFIAPEDTTYNLTTLLSANTGLDTRIGVYTGECGVLECVASGDDYNGTFLSNAIFDAQAGQFFYIVFDSFWGSADYTFPNEFEITEIDTEDPTGPLGEIITFTSTPLTGMGYSKCIVDMNADLLDDIVFVSGNSLDIHYQQVGGGFTNTVYNMGSVANDPSWSIAAGDLDGNGYNDLLFGGGSGASFIWANDDGTGYSETSSGEYIFSQRTNMIDINNDGHLDAFVCHDVDANVYYLNDGNNNMVYNQGGLGENGGNYGSVWIDYDNDCDMDMFIAKCGSDNIDQLHRNDGNGQFTSVAAAAGINDGSETWSSAWADYDNDGDMDCFIGASTSWNGMHKFYLNNGDGTFTNITEGSGFDDVLTMGIENIPGDFNNDGWVDVLGLGSTFMVNNGDMTFTPSLCPFYSAPYGDLNNDGYLDFYSIDAVYYNTLEGNNWIKINPVGTESNKNGIGARITLNSAMGSQIRDVRSAEAFGSMQTLTAHFGIGTDVAIESIHVCWPSGIEDVIYNPEINSTLTIVEGISSSVHEKEELSLNVYPNPVAEILNVNGTDFSSNENLRITDLNGSIVYQGTFGNGQIDVKDFAAGMYLIEAGRGANAKRTTFIKE